jgi:hypothetical protein
MAICTATLIYRPCGYKPAAVAEQAVMIAAPIVRRQECLRYKNILVG